MDTRFWSKADLYRQIDILKSVLGISLLNTPIDSKVLAGQHTLNPTIEEIPFPCNNICGILYKGDHTTSIALNANRSPKMQNFDCMHELIHYFFHDIPYCQCICSDRNMEHVHIQQDSYIEWQANEGAAQFLIPYQDFIPRFVTHISPDNPFLGGYDIQEYLANHYHVTEQVINNRIRSLSYECSQYQNGIPLESIEILSQKKQRERGITTPAYLAKCSFPLEWDAVIGG